MQLTYLILFVTFALFSTNATSATEYPDALPDHRVVSGKKNIAKAWLSKPTSRYKHFVLGANYEAAALNVKLQNGKVLTYKLGQASVFEDRIPRLADINHDGKDEIIVVRAYSQSGAALSVFHIKDNKLKLFAETPDMGHAFGWLNPAGIADFDGDGKLEIAFVRKPHVLGRLELWQYKSGKLVREQMLANTSNHAIGSKNLGLSAVADFNKDGVLDLALPSMDKKSIRFISFKAGEPKEFSRRHLPATVVSNFLLKPGQKPSIKVSLSNGKAVTVEP